MGHYFIIYDDRLHFDFDLNRHDDRFGHALKLFLGPERRGAWPNGKICGIVEMMSPYVCAVCGSSITLGRHKSGWRHSDGERHDHRVKKIDREKYKKQRSNEVTDMGMGPGPCRSR